MQSKMTSPTKVDAIVLCEAQASSEERNVTRLLEFFNVSWRSGTTGNNRNTPAPRTLVVTSAACLAQTLRGADVSGALPAWLANASSVYVHAFRDDEPSNNLLRRLSGDSAAKVTPVQDSDEKVTVAADFPEMCGPMSGMRLAVKPQHSGCVCDLKRRPENFQSIIRTDRGELFFRLTCGAVPFYLNAWDRTVDIDTLAPSYFDVKKSFFEAVPIVFYLKWAFREVAYCGVETNACLIVDDPPLKRRYGFLDFRETLDLMDRHGFSTTVAFIPWNWRRSNPRTVWLFQSRPEKFSLVLHGCDHTRGEFAVRSVAVLNQMIGTSIHRMECFQRRTALESDRVMVFPQGAFSPEVGRALKLNGFVAAVNTEVAPAHAPNQTTIADLWSVAIMRYGTFPIFTRRYAEQGIENFAFDAVLGKPCLIASHHDVFKDHAHNLLGLVDNLNALKWSLTWRPLSEVIRRSVMTWQQADGTNLQRMFASTSIVENVDGRAKNTLLLKEEGDPDCIESVSVDGKTTEFNVEDGDLQVRLKHVGGTQAVVRIHYRNSLETIANRASSRERLKVAARRYLSEFRDNYLSRSDFLNKKAKRLKRLMSS
jgi:hypothetical protein